MFNEICSILLVDDEPLPRRIISDRINKIPNTVLAASLPNGDSAKTFLIDNIVDIVITDIKMPIMDGLELAQTIHAIDPCCFVIIMSGYNEFEYAQKAMQCGVQDYLLKPLQLSRVASSIDRGRDLTMRLRNRLAIPKLDQYHYLEKKIACEPFKSWKNEVDNLLKQPGSIIRITIDKHSLSDGDQQLTFVFKNVIEERFPHSVVLYCGTVGCSYDYLIIPPETPLRHSYSAIGEHLARIVSIPIQWEVVDHIESAEHVLSHMNANKDVSVIDVIQVACQYMEQNLHEAISRDEVAAQVFLSPSYFGQLFKKTMGIGYSEHLTNLRIERAQSLLLTRVPIQDVAVQVGFRDVKYFSDVFRKKPGCFPLNIEKVDWEQTNK